MIKQIPYPTIRDLIFSCGCFSRSEFVGVYVDFCLFGWDDFAGIAQVARWTFFRIGAAARRIGTAIWTRRTAGAWPRWAAGVTRIATAVDWHVSWLFLPVVPVVLFGFLGFFSAASFFGSFPARAFDRSSVTRAFSTLGFRGVRVAADVDSITMRAWFSALSVVVSFVVSVVVAVFASGAGFLGLFRCHDWRYSKQALV